MNTTHDKDSTTDPSGLPHRVQADSQVATTESPLSAATMKWYRALAIALFVIAAAMLAFYLCVTYRSLLHSDSAMKLLLAEEMARQFTLFPRGWNYVNDIIIVFPTLIAAPLSLIFPPSFALHAIVDMIAAGILLYAAYVASRAAGIGGPLRWLLPVLLASGLSNDFVEAVFGQSAYSGTLFILLLIAGWGARYVSSPAQRTERRDRLDLIGIAVLIAAGVAGGQRGLATYAAPLLAAAAAIYFLTVPGTPQSRRAIRLFAIALAATIAGVVIFMTLLHVIDFHEGAIAQSFVGGQLVLNHARLLVVNWFEIFAALPQAGAPFRASTAAITAVRMAFALVVFFLPITLLLRVGSIASTRMRFLVVLHGALLAIMLYMLILTGIVVDEVYGSPRYLMPLVPTALLICVCWLHDVSARYPARAVQAGFAAAVGMLLLTPTFTVIPAFANWPASAALRINPRGLPLELLKREGLHYGYATYWNASVLSVLSGGDVRVAPVNMSDGSLLTPFHHLTAERWYSPDWTTGPSFLLLDGGNQRQLNRPALDALAGAPEKILHAGEYEILVYPFNVGERLGFAAQPHVTIAREPASCAADYVSLDETIQLQPAAFGVMRVRATNRSPSIWSQNSMPYMNPGLRILDAKGKQVAELRAILPHAVSPGESITLALPFRAPAVAGEYTVNSSLVIEGYAWCGKMVPKWASASLSVKP